MQKDLVKHGLHKKNHSTRKHMSWDLVQAVCAYLQANTQSTPEARYRLVRQMRTEHMQRLPFDASFEPFRGPMQNLNHPGDLFTIPNDNVFYLDLFGSEVITAFALRARYFEVLHAPIVETDTRPIVWMVTNAYSHACRLLLHFDRGPRYVLRHLFLSQDELERTSMLHETLLLAFVAMADVRNVEVWCPHAPELPLARFLLSLLGFLRSGEEGEDLVRPPMEEVVCATDLLATTRNQIDRLMGAQATALLPSTSALVGGESARPDPGTGLV